MSIPVKILNRLRYGRSVAAEVAVHAAELRAYVEVIPRVPNAFDDPVAWVRQEGAEARLRDPSFIIGYEIRYVAHDVRYTNTEWGWDYDMVLDDPTTRVKRVFVASADEIDEALAPWLSDLTELCHPASFDSSLLNSPIDVYLDDPAARTHLWR